MLSKMSKTIKWIPGKQRGKPVKVLYTLPVKFKLPSEKTEETVSSIPQASPTTSKAPLAPPALLLNEEVKGDTLTFVDGSLTQTDMLNIIDPSEIKEIHIYKNELPKELSQHKPGFLNIVVTTKNGRSYEELEAPSAPPPPPPPPAPPTFLQQNSDIILNKENIQPGSITVKSGDKKLIEGEHYEVDYETGRLNIIDENLLAQETDIDISFIEVTIDASIEDSKIETTLSIIENPVQNGILKFEYLSSISDEVHIALHDSFGKKIKDRTYTYLNSGLRVDMPLPNLPAGTYFIVAKQGKQTSVKKFITN